MNKGDDEFNSKVERLYNLIFDPNTESGYQRGLNDAWKCADKLNRMTIDEVRDAFSGDPLNHTIERESMFSCCIPNLAIEKIRKYEERKKDGVKVGDVLANNNSYVVVTYINDNEWHGLLLNDYKNAKAGQTFVEHGGLWGWKKTGNHYEQIVNMLKQMQEARK